MQRQRRAAAGSATYTEEEEAHADAHLEEEVIVGRRKKPPSLIGHVVSAVSPKDRDVRRWETLAVFGFLNSFHPSFAVTIDPLALCSALASGPSPDAAASTLLREVHLFLLKGISRGRAPVTAETWERVLSNRLRERRDELSEFGYRNPMQDDEDDRSDESSERPSGYFLLNTEQRIRVLYLLTCWALELTTSSIHSELDKRERGEGNGPMRLDPLGTDHLYHAYWHFASWPALLFREDEKLWDVPHNAEGRWEIACASLTELESFISLLDDATRDEKALRDLVQEAAVEPLLQELRAREAAERRQAHAARHLGVNTANIVPGQRSRRIASYRFEDLLGGKGEPGPVLDRAARQRRREEESMRSRMANVESWSNEGESKSDEQKDRENGTVRRSAALRGQQNRRAALHKGQPQRWGRRSQSDSEESGSSLDLGSESDDKKQVPLESDNEEEEEEEEAEEEGGDDQGEAAVSRKARRNGSKEGGGSSESKESDSKLRADENSKNSSQRKSEEVPSASNNGVLKRSRDRVASSAKDLPKSDPIDTPSYKASLDATGSSSEVDKNAVQMKKARTEEQNGDDKGSGVFTSSLPAAPVVATAEDKNKSAAPLLTKEVEMKDAPPATAVSTSKI